MTPYKTLLLLYLLIQGLGAVHAQESINSINSPLSGKNCSLEFHEKTTGASLTRCSGVSGFNLLVAYDDERMSITVVDSNKKEYPQNYWDVVTPAMSILGETAEWRMMTRQNKNVPVALIVLVKSLDQSDTEHPKEVNFYAITKINHDAICVVAVIPENQTTIKQVHLEADNSAAKPCLSDTETH